MAFGLASHDTEEDPKNQFNKNNEKDKELWEDKVNQSSNSDDDSILQAMDVETALEPLTTENGRHVWSIG